jgi:hypothetical protein
MQDWGEYKIRPYEAKMGANNASFGVGANLVFARLACPKGTIIIFATFLDVFFLHFWYN